MGLREYLLSQIPPEVVNKWKLDEFTAPKETNTAVTEEVKDRKFPGIFRLPITYLDPTELHSLSPIVAQDLELTIPGSENSIYDHLFKPTSLFGRNMIPAWTEYYTTNTNFLEDTQYLITKVHKMPNSWSGLHTSPNFSGDRRSPMKLVVGGFQPPDPIIEDFKPVYSPQCKEQMDYIPTYEKFSNIWHELKEDSFFLEKYGYLEWSILEHFNENSSFLQCLSVVNVISPLISLFLPLIFIVLPFIILKIQQIPINFTVYLEVLKTVAQNHFIGKALMSMTSFSWDKAAYLGLTAGLYFLQIYQNVSICRRFYRNMITLNQHLIELQEFVWRAIKQMTAVLDVTFKLKSYDNFNAAADTHLKELMNIEFELSHIRPFEHSVKKFGESGYMLRCFYRLHSVQSYDEALRYAAGFEGYVENLRGICSNIKMGNIAMAQFSIDASGTTLNDQCYPPLLDGHFAKESRRDSRLGSFGTPTEPPGSLRKAKRRFFIDSPSGSASEACNLEPPAVVLRLSTENEPYIARNTVKFDKNIILSGPNRSGKTTVLKTTALNLIFSQQVGCGFYSSALICPYTHIHSYLNIPDTSGRDSLFQAESRRCKEILDRIKEAKEKGGRSRHFCIFDELYSGTNPDEATKAGYGFLKYLTGFENVDFMLTTHYVKICKKFLKSDDVENYKMYVQCLDNETYNYTYEMKRGISKIKGAAQVMRDMDYPEEIINGMK